ncbi:hypothetical protein [Streptomyces synnematoformans]|uniref:PE-PGRS family protein n=1 Tax=Streptomyces synnematoformans TaxID=415721 RepID=A0ABP5IV00_9ACTN
MTAGWGARTVRAAMFAALCVLLAALGHVLMSGTPVPRWALAAAAAATGAAGWCLAGRERGLVLITSATVAAQTALHASFSLTQAVMHPAAHGGGTLVERWSRYLLCAPQEAAAATAADAPHTAAGMHAAAGHHSMHHGMDAMSPGGHAGHAGHAGQMGHGAGEMSSAGMLGAHLLAALLCGLWLAYGERAAFRILRAVAGWLAAPLRLPHAAPVPPVLPEARRGRPRSERAPRRLLVHSISSRGPPSGIAVR